MASLSAQVPWGFVNFIRETLPNVDPVIASIAGLVTFMAILFAVLIWYQSETRDIRSLWKYILVAGICAVAFVSLFGLLIVYARSRGVVLPIN